MARAGMGAAREAAAAAELWWDDLESDGSMPCLEEGGGRLFFGYSSIKVTWMDECSRDGIQIHVFFQHHLFPIKVFIFEFVIIPLRQFS